MSTQKRDAKLAAADRCQMLHCACLCQRQPDVRVGVHQGLLTHKHGLALHHSRHMGAATRREQAWCCDVGCAEHGLHLHHARWRGLLHAGGLRSHSRRLAATGWP